MAYFDLSMSWLRQTYYALSPSARRWARRLYYLPQDLLDTLLDRHPGYPPRGLIFTGPGDFKATGDRFLRYFIELGQLTPEGTVLDVGSGIGRMALRLTRYLHTEGRYEGFDPVPTGISWCQKHISSRFPHFHFTQVDLKNDLYTSQGNAAAQFKFPYAGAQFDLAILTSVFTHMLPAEVENYLGEIYRTLKPGGRCLATFFLLSPEATTLMQANPGGFQFPYHYGHYRLLDDKVQAANVAFEESYLHEQLRAKGLDLVSTHPGYWSGRSQTDCLEFQDILVLEKKP